MHGSLVTCTIFHFKLAHGWNISKLTLALSLGSVSQMTVTPGSSWFLDQSFKALELFLFSSGISLGRRSYFFWFVISSAKRHCPIATPWISSGVERSIPLHPTQKSCLGRLLTVPIAKHSRTTSVIRGKFMGWDGAGFHPPSGLCKSSNQRWPVQKADITPNMQPAAAKSHMPFSGMSMKSLPS